LYVQNTFNTFYFLSSCPRDDERSEESRGHDRRPTTDRVSVPVDRHEARSKPASCPFARTADRAPADVAAAAACGRGGHDGTLAFARKGSRDYW
jgi:hypothetical protein